MKTSFNVIIIFLLSFTILRAQEYSVGAGVGLGSFMGDFPSQTVFGTKINVETTSPFIFFDKVNINFAYGQEIDKFLPESYDNNHYPYFISFGLSGLYVQELHSDLKIKEGLGFIYLNDQSFDDINTWNYGFQLSLIGILKVTQRTFVTGNIDYGITLNNTNSSFVLISLGIEYKL